MTDSEPESGQKMSTIGGFCESEHKSLSTRNQRVRYWSNNEELRLIELWRQNFNKINVYDKNEPVHRVISEGMKERRMNFNSQECRRRINLLRNKYFAERKRLQLLKLPATASDWPMFPFVHCIYQPRVPNPDVHIEQKTLDRVHAAIAALRPTLKEFTPHKGYIRVKYAHDPKAFPFLDVGSDTVVIKEEPEIVIKQETSSTRHSMSREQKLSQITNPAFTKSSQTSTTPEAHLVQSRHSKRLRMLPKRGHITAEHIDQLRFENQLLSTQRDQQLKQLEIKEEELNQLQLYFDLWSKQQKELLQKLIDTVVTN